MLRPLTLTLTVPPADIRNSEVIAPFSLAGTIIFSDINGPLFSVDVPGRGWPLSYLTPR